MITNLIQFKLFQLIKILFIFLCMFSGKNIGRLWSCSCCTSTGTFLFGKCFLSFFFCGHFVRFIRKIKTKPNQKNKITFTDIVNNFLPSFFLICIVLVIIIIITEKTKTTLAVLVMKSFVYDGYFVLFFFCFGLIWFGFGWPTNNNKYYDQTQWWWWRQYNLSSSTFLMMMFWLLLFFFVVGWSRFWFWF